MFYFCIVGYLLKNYIEVIEQLLHFGANTQTKIADKMQNS